MRSLLLPVAEVLALFVCLFLDQAVNSKKIIIFHHLASYSHQIQTWPLALALSRKGHEVTYITPHHPKEPNANITALVPQKLDKAFQGKVSSDVDINLKIQRKMPNLIDYVPETAIEFCEALITSPEFKKWLKENPKADLVIVDNMCGECGTSLAYKLGAKYIFFSTTTVMPYEYDTLGFLPESSVIPELETYALKPPLGFLDRISNALDSLNWRWKWYSDYVPRIDALVRKHLDVGDMPYLDELVRNPSLVLYTGDVVTDYPRSLPPLFVNIAGIHVRKATEGIPKEIEDFITSNSTKEASTDADPDDGFIYISLGSMITSNNLLPETKETFFGVIKAFPHIKFLWKWNGEFPSDIPKNLYLGKWFPQVDILAHPKIRGFVTQAGRPSVMEAVFNGVPMISFPVIGDQEPNANRLEQMGILVRLDIGTVTLESFKKGVEQVLYNKQMKTRMSKLQKIFVDKPMSPVDTALWHTEYVLRHEDTSHLKPAGSEQYWFIRRQLDVWVTLTIASVLFVFGISTVLAKALRLFAGPSKKLKAN